MDNFTKYLYYTNYWPPTGQRESKGQQPSPAGDNKRLDLRKKWKIVITVFAIVAAISLILVIYDTVQLQKPATLGSSSPTTVTTAAPTTSAVYLTTMGLCIDNFLRYGGMAGDETATDTITVNFGSGRIAGKQVTNGKIDVNIKLGFIMLSETSELVTVLVSYSSGYDSPDPDKGQYFYHRQVDSSLEEEAIKCLVKDDKVRAAYVFTWVGFTYGGKQIGTFQCIIVFSDSPATYSIRIYSTDLVHTDMYQFRIHDAVAPESFDFQLKADDVAGKTLIRIHTESHKYDYPSIERDESCMC